MMNLGDRDLFFWFVELDRASTVAAVNSGLVSQETAASAARAIAAAAADGPRPTDYLDVIELLRRFDPARATAQIHLGRSRQDILATVHRLLLRDRMLALLDSVNDLRSSILAAAARHPHDPVPGYTNGVQAQPITFGHQLLGYEAALGRTAQRILQSLPRLNRCPLGAAAMATSSFQVDRDLLAELLGFDGPEAHAFDAAQLAPIDIGFEQAALAMGAALTIGTLIQDIHAQYHHARPWIVLEDPSHIAPSTLMPQKRNPVALNRARLLASEVLGDGVTTAFAAHNVPSGLTDYKRYDAATTLDRARALVGEVQAIIAGMRLDPEAALAQLRGDWSCASELAGVLQREAGVPIEVGHAFASALVTAARAEHLAPEDTPHTLFRTVWASEVGGDYPLDRATTRAALDPSAMVQRYRGLGGPQRDQVRALHEQASDRLRTDRHAAAASTSRLEAAAQRLRTRFEQIR